MQLYHLKIKSTGQTFITSSDSLGDALFWLSMYKNLPLEDVEQFEPKTSSDAFSHLIRKVDGSRGAPMGRANFGEPQPGKRVFDRAVPFVNGAYDKGGAYWGAPANLRVKYHSDLSYWEFYRK